MSFSTHLTAADRIRAKSALVYETAEQRRISVEQALANVASGLYDDPAILDVAAGRLIDAMDEGLRESRETI
jgi:hypothetical protein